MLEALFGVISRSVIRWTRQACSYGTMQSFVTRRYSLWMSLFLAWMQNSNGQMRVEFPDYIRDSVQRSFIISNTYDQTEAMTLEQES